MSSASTRRAPWLVPVVILAVAAVLVLVSVLSGRGETEQDAQPAADEPVAEVGQPEAPPEIEMARLDAEDPLAAGPVDAPVTLVVYSDYQCPFCASWAADTAPSMLAYAGSGDLRIEFRDVAIFGPESERSAQAAYAAGLQGRYLDYHGELFAGGEKRPAEELDDDGLTAIAEDIGLDVDRFVSDLDSAEVAEAVQRNVDEAAAIGAFSTPAFLLAGQPILGAQPTGVFVQAMEQALAEAES